MILKQFTHITQKLSSPLIWRKYPGCQAIATLELTLEDINWVTLSLFWYLWGLRFHKHYQDLFCKFPPPPKQELKIWIPPITTTLRQSNRALSCSYFCLAFWLALAVDQKRSHSSIPKFDGTRRRMSDSYLGKVFVEEKIKGRRNYSKKNWERLLDFGTSMDHRKICVKKTIKNQWCNCWKAITWISST